MSSLNYTDWPASSSEDSETDFVVHPHRPVQHRARPEHQLPLPEPALPFLPSPEPVTFPSCESRISRRPVPSQSQRTRRPSHICMPTLKTRNGGWKGWPDGVVSGGMVMDLAENLSRHNTRQDECLTEWILHHYVEPFGCVHRREGLVIQDPNDIGIIQLAHSRYVEIKGPNSAMEQLWVPGLEPTYIWQGEAKVPPMTGPHRLYPWNPAESQVRYFVPVERKGVSLGKLLDANKWEREIWTLVTLGDEGNVVASTEQGTTLVKPKEQEDFIASIERDVPFSGSLPVRANVPVSNNMEKPPKLWHHTPSSTPDITDRSAMASPVTLPDHDEVLTTDGPSVPLDTTDSNSTDVNMRSSPPGPPTSAPTSNPPVETQGSGPATNPSDLEDWWGRPNLLHPVKTQGSCSDPARGSPEWDDSDDWT